MNQWLRDLASILSIMAAMWVLGALSMLPGCATSHSVKPAPMEEVVRGTVEVLSVDPVGMRGEAELKHLLTTLDGTARYWLRLRPADAVDRWTGEVLEVTGSILFGASAQGDDPVLEVGTLKSLSVQTLARTLPNTTGHHRHLVVPVRFTDQDAETCVAGQPCTVAEIRAAVEKDYGPWWRWASYGKLNVTPVVVDYLTIPLRSDGAGCGFGKVRDLVYQGLRARGTNAKQYEKVWYGLTSESCAGGHWGMAVVGGRDMMSRWRAWVPQVAVHEGGHTYGLSHASGRRCAADWTGSQEECPRSEYADSGDPMGGNDRARFSCLNLIRLGWLSIDGSLPFATRPRTGTFMLRGGGTPGLESPRCLVTAHTNGRVMVTEYRPPIGYDQFPGQPSAEGLSMRIGTLSPLRGNTERVDPTMRSPCCMDAVLRPGRSFGPITAGRITGLEMEVQVGGVRPSPATPTPTPTRTRTPRPTRTPTPTHTGPSPTPTQTPKPTFEVTATCERTLLKACFTPAIRRLKVEFHYGRTRPRLVRTQRDGCAIVRVRVPSDVTPKACYGGVCKPVELCE